MYRIDKALSHSVYSLYKAISEHERARILSILHCTLCTRGQMKWAIPFNIHTPPMDGVFCFDNPQKITFTKDPSEISMDELNLLDTPQNYLWMKLFSLYTTQKCLWMKSFFLYTPQKCLWMRLFFLYTPQKCLWIRLFFLYASQKCLDEVMFLVYLSNMCT